MEPRPVPGLLYFASQLFSSISPVFGLSQTISVLVLDTHAISKSMGFLAEFSHFVSGWEQGQSTMSALSS